MIIYERLWKTMEEKDISQYKLIHHYKISSSQIHRLKRNNYVSTHTLDMLCSILNCCIEDIVEFQYDSSQETEFGIVSARKAQEENEVSTRKKSSSKKRKKCKQ